jgi:hypothetical protein
MLEELKRWKVETAAMQTMGPVGQDTKPDSFWRDGGTITSKANSDGAMSILALSFPSVGSTQPV